MVGASSSWAAREADSAAADAMIASAAALSVEGRVAGAPLRVFQLLLFALRNSADAVPTTTLSVYTVQSRVEFIPVNGPSSSWLPVYLVLHPGESSSAMIRPSFTSFLFRFLDFLSGFGSAVR